MNFDNLKINLFGREINPLPINIDKTGYDITDNKSYSGTIKLTEDELYFLQKAAPIVPVKVIKIKIPRKLKKKWKRFFGIKYTNTFTLNALINLYCEGILPSDFPFGTKYLNLEYPPRIRAGK